MKTKRISYAIDIINLILWFFVVSSVDIMIAFGMEAGYVPIEHILIALIIICSYIMKSVINRFIVFLVANILVIAAVACLPLDVMTQIKMIGFATVLVAFNNYYWINDNAREASDIAWPVGILFVILNIILMAKKAPAELAVTVYGYLIAFIIFEAVKLVLYNINELLLSGQLTRDMPVKEMFIKTSIGAGLVVFAGILMIILIRAESFINALVLLGERIKEAFLRFWFSILTGEGFDESIIDRAQFDMGNLPEEGESSPVLQKLLNILLALALITALLIGLMLLIESLRSFFKDYMRKDRNKRKNVGLADGTEIRERIERAGRKNKRPGLFSGNDYEKLRYIYRKKLLYYKKKGSNIKSTNTPFENADEVRKKHEVDFSLPTSIYTRFRYDPEAETTAGDVSAMKEALKNTYGK